MWTEVKAWIVDHFSREILFDILKLESLTNGLICSSCIKGYYFCFEIYLPSHGIVCLILWNTGCRTGSVLVEQRSHREFGGPELPCRATYHFSCFGKKYKKSLESGRSRTYAQCTKNVPGDGPGTVYRMPAKVSRRWSQGSRGGRNAGDYLETPRGLWVPTEQHDLLSHCWWCCKCSQS